MRNSRGKLRAKGILKMVGAFAPVVVFGIGGFSAVGFLVASINKEGQAINEYKKTATYSEIYKQDSAEIEEKLENKEYSISEAAEKQKYIGSDNYVKELIRRDLEGNEEYQAILKYSEKLRNYGVGTCSGLAAVGLLTAAPWEMNIGNKLHKSAKRDFEAANTFTVTFNPPPKFKKNKKKDDENEEENELIDVNDYLEQFQNKE